MNSKLVFVIITSSWLFTAVKAGGSSPAVVAATDQVAAAVAVPVTVSLPFIASVVVRAAGPVVVIGIAIYNGDTEYDEQ